MFNSSDMPTRRVRLTPRAFWLDSVLGHAVLTHSFKECNHPLSAESLLLLARGQVMDFELKSGFDFSSLAAQLFGAQGNPVGLVKALSVANCATSSLGLPDACRGREDLAAVLEDGAAVARAAYGTDWEAALAVCQLLRHSWLHAVTWGRAELAGRFDDYRQAVVSAGAEADAQLATQEIRVLLLASQSKRAISFSTYGSQILSLWV